MEENQMEIINFFDSDRQNHWLEEIRKSDWGAGAFLHKLISNGTFFDAVGEDSKVLLLIDGDELISFCTYAQKDDIQPTELTPWIGFVYTFPEHRGHRYMDFYLRKSNVSQKKNIYLKCIYQRITSDCMKNMDVSTEHR